MRPLSAIASSGEISRVMLASKAVLAAQDQVPVLIFDEIDANVGGEMGHAIGQTMLAVAQYHQVLTITHLPQVAAQATQHLAVAKSIREGRTFTEVDALKGSDRVQEIARMLGGSSQAAAAHAEELLATP